jgi:PAS domain S-box-containing protein
VDKVSLAGASSASSPDAVDKRSGNRRLSDDVLRLAFDRSPMGIVVSGLDGKWLRINERCSQMLGYAEADLVGSTARDVTFQGDLLVDREFAAAALAGKRTSMERDKRYTRSDGSLLWTRVVVQLVRDEARQALYFVSFLQDISERHHAQDLLHDSERTLRAVIDNTPATISVKTRDFRYTLVNREFEQRHGVSSGRIVGHSDTEFLPAAEIDDIHARDLAVLDGGGSSQEEKTVVTEGQEQILLLTRFPLRDEAGVIHGVCTASTDITERRLSERAKRERLECSELVYSSLAEHRFVLHGQPIVHLESMTAATSELLIRMRKSRGADELIPPGSFLPAAERFGLIGVIDEWVLGRAVKLAGSGHRVSVNLSAKTVSDQSQVDQIEARVVAIGTAAENLTFEITETAVADDLDAARGFSIRMRKLGCGLSLDDFGVGHGSFTYLRHLPVDYLKIDAQFVRDLLGDDDDQQVVEAIIGVAHQFKIKTIAEGVENEATLAQLRRLGVDFVQGYLTGRPMPLAECWKFTEQQYPGEAHA